MSQVRTELPSRSPDSHNGDPLADPAPPLVPAAPSAGQDTNVHPSSPPTSAIASTTPDSSAPTSFSQKQSKGMKEENTPQEHSASHKSLVNGTTSSKTKSGDKSIVGTETVTRQPQGRVTVRTPPTSTLVPLLQNGAGHVPEGLATSSNGEAGNGAMCSELRSLSSSQKPHRKLQSHHSINSQLSKKSKSSSKSVSSQIPTEAQEDCCVHCILSCLFCEFLTLCNIMLDCATCGSCSSEDSCICCCCCGSGECADCDLPCDMDCGIIDACCESADCLEICMECCGLCFSS